MTLLTRVASFAALSLSLVGLLDAGTAARAADLAGPSIVRSASMAPSIDMQNTPAAAEVPGPRIEIAAADLDTADTADHGGGFHSLDQAVAAQDAGNVDEAVRCLAGAVYFESKGEPLSGQLAVAQVIINRAKSGRFPPDVCGVVTQRGQFSFVRGGQIPSIDIARGAYRTAIAIARIALAKAWDGAAQNALYFNTANRMPGARLQRVAAIGNHIFYR